MFQMNKLRYSISPNRHDFTNLDTFSYQGRRLFYHSDTKKLQAILNLVVRPFECYLSISRNVDGINKHCYLSISRNVDGINKHCIVSAVNDHSVNLSSKQENWRYSSHKTPSVFVRKQESIIREMERFIAQEN